MATKAREVWAARGERGERVSVPRVPKGTTLRTDEEGEYVAYHRFCNWRGCGVELTSRNRSNTGALRCTPCGLEAMRELSRASYKSKGSPQVESPQEQPSAPPPQPPVTPSIRADPPYHLDHQEKQKAHYLLQEFLYNPTNAAAKEALLSELLTYEIRDLMWRL